LNFSIGSYQGFLSRGCLLAITLLALGAASPALAAELQRGGPGNGTGTGVPVEQNIALDGLLEDLIHENLATALGISPAELAARLEAGETIFDIGLSLDFDATTIGEIVTQARADALVQAVALGLITQEQADWLASRGNQDPIANYVDGICDGTGDCLADGISLNTMTKNTYRNGFGK
jgi:hypothetical protein